MKSDKVPSGKEETQALPHNGEFNNAETLSKTAQKIEKNKKVILWATCGVSAVVIVILVWVFAFLKPAQHKADVAVDKADNLALVYEAKEQAGMTGVDSTGVDSEALKVLESYEAAAAMGHDGGNRAKLMAGIYAYKTGDYDKALKYLDDFDADDEIIAATAQALKGDCYVMKDEFQKAVECYKEGAKISNDNPALTPFFLEKEAVVERELGNFDAEAQLYQTLLDTYPQYGMSHGMDYEAYLERAKASKK